MNSRGQGSGKRHVGVLGGLRAFTGGVSFILGTPSVWGYALVPALMVGALLCGLGGLGIWVAARASDALVSVENGVWAHVGNWLLTAAFTVVALGLAALLALCLAQPFSSFALLAIARAQQERLTGHGTAPAVRPASWLRGLWVTLAMVILCVPLFAGLFVINLIFPPAMLVTVPLKFLLCSWLLAWNFLDYPLGLHGHGITATLRWMGRHFGAVTSFGAMWTFLLIIPGLVLFLLPMGVAGATRLVLEAEGLLRHGFDPDL
jgi:CysZ protein